MRLKTAKQAARQLLRDCGIREPGTDIAIVTNRLKLPVIEEPLDRTIAGMLLTAEDDSGSGIVVRLDDSPFRKRFTIAHAVGHYVLKHHLELSTKALVDRKYRLSARASRTANRPNPIEMEANQFAVNLLVPQDQLECETYALVGDSIPDDMDISDLAKTFCVSEQVMVFRLVNLKLA